MAQVRLFARKKHYKDHLRPIWDALPDEYKMTGEWIHGDRLLIAGYPDIRKGSPYIYVEHGAGQSYQGLRSGGWSGGEHHHECELFLCPNQEVADRWTARYPSTPTAVVGCPRLDQYHGWVPPKRTVAITFHWDCQMLPETRSAFPHYRAGLIEMVTHYRHQGYVVLGHSHPRYERVLKPFWVKLGVEWTDDPLRDASTLIADNTSLMAEFMAVNRPVVALNAPWYRREVDHGQRFWTWPVTYADTAKEAASLSLESLPRPDWHPYAFADGRCAQRAADAIVRHLT